MTPRDGGAESAAGAAWLKQHDLLYALFFQQLHGGPGFTSALCAEQVAPSSSPPPCPRDLQEMDTYTLFFDGSYVCGTGTSGWGAILLRGDVSSTATAETQVGELHRAGGVLQHIETHNYAEASALLAGLNLARSKLPDPGSCKLVVRGDSATVIRALHGKLPTKNKRLTKHLRKCVRLLSWFGSVSAAWVPRAKNAAADHVAGVASSRRRS